MNIQGNCYVYNLCRGHLADNDPTELVKKTSFAAHSKYALKCAYSPDAT